jgi:hypothetical protein
LWNTESALRCDCGYDFKKESVDEFYNKQGIVKNRFQYFSESLAVWLVFSFVCNILGLMIFNKIPTSDIHKILMVVAIQLFGYVLAFLAFRKGMEGIGMGIITASIPYLMGIVARIGCAPPGIPFPLSLLLSC